jgi:hypothetical protein
MSDIKITDHDAWISIEFMQPNALAWARKELTGDRWQWTGNRILCPRRLVKTVIHILVAQGFEITTGEREMNLMAIETLEGDFLIQRGRQLLLRLHMTNESMIVTSTGSHVIVADISEAKELQDWLKRCLDEEI